MGFLSVFPEWIVLNTREYVPNLVLSQQILSNFDEAPDEHTSFASSFGMVSSLFSLRNRITSFSDEHHLSFAYLFGTQKKLFHRWEEDRSSFLMTMSALALTDPSRGWQNCSCQRWVCQSTRLPHMKQGMQLSFLCRDWHRLKPDRGQKSLLGE